MIADDQPRLNIMKLTARERTIFWEGYHSGMVEGIGMGRAQAADEAERSWAAMAASIRVVASHVAYSVLCDRRGETARAERARQDDRRLGLPVQA